MLASGEIKLHGLALRAFMEFDDVGDFYWKIPGFIEEQRKVEVQKLLDYFPLTGDPKEDAYRKELRRKRWMLESRKLEEIFPYHMAAGGLFSCASLFETYCLQLCKQIETHIGVPVASTPGLGVACLLKYFSKAGLEPDQLPTANPVQAAIKIRNCLFHASGVLAWSREEAELRKMVKRVTYLSKAHAETRSGLEVAIVASPFGDRLQVSIDYTYIAVFYFRDYVLELCNRWEEIQQKSADGTN